MYAVEDRDWQAEDDAQILARSVEIKSDKNRYEKAKNAAKRMLDKKQNFLNSLRKVANNKTVVSGKEERLNSTFQNSINSSRR